MKPRLFLFSCLVFLAGPSLFAVRAQLFFLSDLSTHPTDVVRLYMDTAQNNAAPVGTTYWLVADLSGTGLTSSLYGEGGADGYPPAGMESITDAQILNLTHDSGNDRRFYVGQVDGTLLGAQPGKLNQPGIEVNSSYENARIFLYLWNDANANSVIGDAGDTFGLFDFGVSPPPGGGLGNAAYVIDGNVYADRITLSAVPEPEAYGLYLSVAIMCWACRRLYQNQGARRLKQSRPAQSGPSPGA